MSAETPASTPPPPPQALLLHPPITVTDMASAPAISSSSQAREYRKGNWTIQETLILITAKKMDDERRKKMSSSAAQSRAGGELRWKWVENFCWEHGCHRSQNQCNDKWDNLLRDYRKVRDYNSKSGDASYWKMEKHVRKDRNLPSNMALEVFQALNEVVKRTGKSPVALPAEPISVRAQVVSDTSQSCDAEKDEFTKRRKVGNIGSSIVEGASVLAHTLRICEENKDKRHQEAMEVEQRRLEVEEAETKANSLGIATLVSAVSNLSAAVESLISGGTENT